MNEQLKSRVEEDASMNGWEILIPSQTEAEDETEVEAEDGIEDEIDDFNSEYERTEVKDSELQMFAIDLPPKILEKYTFLRDLPPDVALMGGTARSIAREVITGDVEPTRDIDLIQISDARDDYRSSPEILDQLSQEFMPDDYSYGYGIKSEELDRYFRTRDFTVNQSLVLDGKLIVSDLAYNDLQENIIRPAYNRFPYANEELSDRLFLKSLMFISVLDGCCSSIPTTEDLGDKEYCSDFNMALFLNKAMGRGVDVAIKFTNQLADYDFIPERLRYRPKATAKWLLSDENMHFNFRDSVDERFKAQTESVLPPQSAANDRQFHLPKPPIKAGEWDDWDELTRKQIYSTMHHTEAGDEKLKPALRLMQQYHSTNPDVRAALAEYDGSDYSYKNEKGDREAWDLPSPEEVGIPPLEEIEDNDDFVLALDYTNKYDINHSFLLNQIIEDTDELYTGKYSDADFEEINNYYDQSYHHPDYDSYRDRIVFQPNDGDLEDEKLAS